MKKVNFKKLSIVNFLSVGEEPVTVEFSKGLHVITGKNKDKPDRRNAIGKSTIADALYFAIFGETLRELKKDLIVSTYIENNTPKNIPNNVAETPIKKPTIKKIFVIEIFWTPIDFKIAISLVLFLTKIVSPDIMLKAATIIIKERIINITFFSIFKALINAALFCFQFSV